MIVLPCFAPVSPIRLGPRKGNIGDQTYVLPQDTDLTQWGSVLIWCERFGLLFSPAA